MEPPLCLALSKEVRWVLREPVLVTWQDSTYAPGEMHSLGQPCPINGTTAVTLWVGEDSTTGKMVLLLHLNIVRRVACRPKAFEFFLVLLPDSCRVAETPSTEQSRLAPDVLKRILDAYGLQKAEEESRAYRWLHIPFAQDQPSNVLMNIQPKNAKAFKGTPLHLLMLFRSLSRSQKFDVYARYSDYAKRSLANLCERLKSGVSIIEIDLKTAYAGEGGQFNNWEQYNPQEFKPSVPDEERPTVSSGSGKPVSLQATPTGPPVGDACNITQTSTPPPYCETPERDPWSRLPKRCSLLTAQVTRSTLQTVPKRARGMSYYMKSHIFCVQVLTDVLAISQEAQPDHKFQKLRNHDDQVKHDLSAAVTPSSTVANSDDEDLAMFHHLNGSRELSASTHGPSKGNALHQRLQKTAFSHESDTEPAMDSDVDHGLSPAVSSSSQCPDIIPSKFRRGRRAASRHKAYPVKEVQNDDIQPSLDPNGHVNHDISSGVVTAMEVLVRELLPDLTTNFLQEIMQSFQDSAQTDLDMHEFHLREIVDDGRTSLQEKVDEIINDFDSYSQDALAEIREIVEEAVADLYQKATDPGTKSLAARPLADGLTDRESDPVVRATRVFSRDFENLPISTKVAMLTKIADEGFAKVFLTVDDRMRAELVTVWTS